MKAIIIGAGIGGLTAGIALRQAGIEVDIYEREAELKIAGAGIALWANAVYALEKIGVGNDLTESSMAAQVAGLRNRKGEGLTVSDIEALKQIANKPTIVIHRAELQNILLDKFDGTVHYAKRMKSYYQVHNTVHASFEDGDQTEGDVLIACDGIHSAIRHQMFPQSKPIYAGYTVYRGVTEFDHEQIGDMWGEAWGYGMRFGVLPLRDNRVYWYATANAEIDKTVPMGIRQQTLLKLFTGWYHPVEKLLKATPEDKILQHDCYDIAPLQNWCDGRVILLGDAAHAMTPNMGQGACQAIEDAVVLGQLFDGKQDIDDILTAYQELRLPRANQILKQSQTIGKVGQLENPLLCNLRNMAMKLTPSSVQMNNLASVISYRV